MSPEVGSCFHWSWYPSPTVLAVCFMVTNITRSENWHGEVSHNSRHFEIGEYQIYHKENLSIWLRYLGEWDRMLNCQPFLFSRMWHHSAEEKLHMYLMLLDEQEIRLKFISHHQSWLIGILAAAFLQGSSAQVTATLTLYPMRLFLAVGSSWNFYHR